MRMRSELIGARLSGVVIAILPYLVIPFILWRKPEWMQELATHPMGPPLLVGAILLQIVGFVWLQRIVRTEAW